MNNTSSNPSMLLSNKSAQSIDRLYKEPHMLLAQLLSVGALVRFLVHLVLVRLVRLVLASPLLALLAQ
jgi:uncharacterized membrane protein